MKFFFKKKYFIAFFILAGCIPKKNTIQEISRNEKEQLFTYLYVDGVSARLKNDFDAALLKMQECIKLKPDEPAVYYETALSLHLSGKPLQAIPYAEKAFFLNKKNIWYGLFYADLLEQTGNLSASVKIKEHLHTQFPQNMEIILRVAQDYRQLSRPEKSLDWLNKAEKLAGISEEICMEKISILQTLNRRKEMEDEYKKLIELYNREPRYMQYLADYYLQNNRWKEADSLFRKIFLINPDYAPALISISGYFMEKMEFEKGMDYIFRLIASPEIDMQIKSRVLSALEHSMMVNKSGKILEDGLKKSVFLLYRFSQNRFEPNYWMARYYSLYNPNPDSAYFFQKNCLRYDKTNPGIFRSVIEYQTDKQQWDSCLKYASEAAELYPNEPYFFFAKGVALYYKDNYQAAIADFKYAREIPGIEKKEIIRSLFFEAKAYHHLKKYPESFQCYETLLKINPDYAPALNNYAWILAESRSSLEKAEKLARKAYELQPDSPQYADTYGYVLLIQKKYSQALEKFKQAHSLAPEKPFYMEHIGDALYLLGSYNEAIHWWNKARDAGGNTAVLQKKINEGISNE